MSGQRLVDLGAYLAVRTVLCVVQALSLKACFRLSQMLAWLSCDVVKFRRQVIDDNLRHAYPQMHAAARLRLARQMWEHLFLMIVEVAHTRRKIHATNGYREVELGDGAEMTGRRVDQRPTMMVAGHYGNFEVSGYVLGLFGFPTYTVARPLDNPYLDRFLNKFRGSTGQFILPKNDCAEQILQILAAGGTLTLLGDQYAAGRKNCWVDFYGRPASAHKAIALFALSNNAPLLVSYCRRTDGPLRFETGIVGIADPADPNFDLQTVPRLTQWYTKQLETMINHAPEQYWWLHRRWKGDPPARVRKKWAAERGQAA